MPDPDVPDSSDRPASHNSRGIEEVLQVIELLKNAGIICCIVGGKALLYYGVPRIPTVRLPMGHLIG